MQRRTPIFIVTSSRPRVGKTLVARALTEYFPAQNRPIQAFDVNPDEFSLIDPRGKKLGFIRAEE